MADQGSTDGLSTPVGGTGAMGAPAMPPAALSALATLETQIAELRRYHEQSTKAGEELARRERELEQRFDELAQLERELSERGRRDQDETGRLAGELERERARAADLARELDELRGHVEREERGARETAESALRSAQEAQELTRRAAELAREAGELRAAVAAGKNSGEELEKKLREAGAREQSLRAEVERSRAAGPERDQVTHEMESRLRGLMEENQALQELASKSEEEARRERERFGKAELAVGELKKRLQSAAGEAGTLRERAETAEREAAEARTRAEAAERRAREAAAGGSGGGGRGATGGNAGGGVPAAIAEHLTRRFSRLRRFKEALQVHSRKVMNAKAALQKRHEQYEALLGQRQKLAEASAALESAQKRAARAQGGAKAAAVVAYLSVSLAILAGLSWAVVRQTVPAVYAARAELGADAKGRTITEREAGAWQTYMEELIKDPAMIAAASERMAARGLVTMGSPAELASVLRDDLAVQSPKVGSLQLELRGEWAERTTRVLDTFVVALAAKANETRDRRIDGASTEIIIPAGALEEPVEDRRLGYAGALLGCMAFVCALLWTMLWRQLSKAKRKFEGQQQVEAVLAEANWPDAKALLAAQSKPGR